MICQADISNIKTEIGENIGRKIMIRGANGRKKFFQEEAVIKNIYPNIFIVKDEKRDTNLSFRYTDILTKDLQILLFDGKDYFPFEPTTVVKEKF